MPGLLISAFPTGAKIKPFSLECDSLWARDCDYQIIIAFSPAPDRVASNIDA